MCIRDRLWIRSGEGECVLPLSPDRDLRRVARGGDFTFAGYDPDLAWVEKVMTEAFLCKVEGRLG
eukprot:3808581-Alexandrium_andersonii.AAC.1